MTIKHHPSCGCNEYSNPWDCVCRVMNFSENDFREDDYKWYEEYLNELNSEITNEWE
jgi:hypothetical protein